tara:strand:- start:813 stop:1190 length:378 start_codon:yes stop_codon:yes gene_type:complete
MKELEAWQKVFCQQYTIHGNATQAYHFARPEATYGSCRTASSKLLAKDNIKEEIDFLKDEFATSVHQTKESTIRDLIRAAEEAKADGQFTAYFKARDMIIKMCGFYAPEKVEVESTTYSIGFDKD